MARYDRTKEEAREVAKKYQHRVDFKRGDNGYWQWSQRQGKDFYESIVSHMIPKGTWYKKLVYTYTFKNNVIYIGITNDRNQRISAHKEYGAVAEYRQSQNEEPVYKEITDYIELSKARNLEKELIKKYKSLGWTVLNKTKGGESGGNNEFLTKEECQKEALKYNYRWEFGEGSNSHYAKARKRGWIDEICSHMEERYITWNRENILEYAKKCNLETITEFSKEYSGAYHASQRLGIEDELKEYFDWRGGKKWTKKEIHEIALKYKIRSQFIDKNKNAASYAQHKGWYDEITSHMDYLPKGKKWTKEEVHAEALKYKTRTEFARATDTKGCNKAYQSAIHNGWIDEVCSHMVKPQPKNKGENAYQSKLTKEQVIWLRENKGNYSVTKIAKEYGIAKGTIYSILSGNTWKHI